MSDLSPIDTTLSRLSPDARRLLWILSCTVAVAPESVPETLVEKVWLGESVEEERLRQVGRYLRAIERMPAESRPETPPIPPEVRKRINALLENEDAPKPDVAPFVGELVEARLVTHAPLVEGGEAMSLSCSNEAAEASAKWAKEHPEEIGGKSDADVLVAFGERYAAAFVASVEGKVPGGTTDAGIDAGSMAVAYFLGARAAGLLAEMLGEAVRAANDAAIVGPVAAIVEAKGALDVVMAEFDRKNDTLGEAGTLAALAGYRNDRGEIDKAIELEVRSLAPLARLDNVVPRAIVHLRLSGLLETLARKEESGAHLAAALIYRALSGVDFSSELRTLVTRIGRDHGYALPSVSELWGNPALGDLVRFVEKRGVPVQDVQADLDSLVRQVRQHIGV